MKKYILLSLILFTGSNARSQITFQSGYFINNSGQTIKCLIKNIDWKKNPKSFDYKLSDSDNSETKTIDSVKEFAVYNACKYVSSLVNIDTSNINLNDKSYSREPVFTQKRLFLKVILEGKASLYLFDDGYSKYFYKTDTSPIKQLVYKKYYLDNFTTNENNKYRQQLWLDLQCSNITTKTIEAVNYTYSDLYNLFKLYNDCTNTKYFDYQFKNKRKNPFQIHLKLGLDNSSISFYKNADRNADFGHKLNFIYGIETEYILPFNSNKWSVFLAPTYHSFHGEKTDLNNDVKVNFNSILIPIGLRYYVFLNPKSKLFINYSLSNNYTFKSQIKYEDGVSYEITSSGNAILGAGLSLNSKYNIELRYIKTNNLTEYNNLTSKYISTSIVLGYRIL